MGGPGARIAAGPGDVDELEEVCERAGGLHLTPHGRSMRFDISNMRCASKRPSDGEARLSHHITLCQAGTMMSAFPGDSCQDSACESRRVRGPQPLEVRALTFLG